MNPRSSAEAPRTLIAELAAAVGSHLAEGVDLKTLTTWRIGGKAWAVVEPGSLEEIDGALTVLRRSGVPWIVMGGGSNLLFDDQGFEGVIIRLGKRFSRLEINEGAVRAEAGSCAIRFARAVGAAGLAGAEHLIGIPGTVGGLLYMNGGSNRQAIGASVVSVGFFDSEGNHRLLPAAECAFGYRSSIFSGNASVITGAEFRFGPGDRAAIRRAMLETLRTRRAKFPLKQPNCGSVFTTDAGFFESWGPVGAVIERLGLKGIRAGGARVSEKHANFIVNEGSATSSEVLALIETVRSSVHRVTGRWLECEVRYVSPGGTVMKAHHARA